MQVCPYSFWFETGVGEFADSADATPIEPIPEYTAREEYEDSKKWRVVQIGDKAYRIDMEAIDPFKKVLSHGGSYNFIVFVKSRCDQS